MSLTHERRNRGTRPISNLPNTSRGTRWITNLVTFYLVYNPSSRYLYT